ncbi:MAG: flagellar transcriptional regulator FlhC [Gammaproteobacteria bacterium]|nr:flagellar transcriptional regulator FlhC [Gammaproteobacteria bacterium]MDH5653001.1 flagellar transcriptional regulator FlhC [Gammaproteobacteria bacterium]
MSAACGSNNDCTSCAITSCVEASRTQDAVRLIQAGARVALVCQLTDLPKKRVKRIYSQLKGQPSPQGQMPFTDVWYLATDLRMLHASLVWHLYRRIAREDRSEADTLLKVYESYLHLVNKPELDLTRTFFVLRLMTMSLWETRQCRHCDNTFLAPTDEKHDIACPGCRLYHRYRCARCGGTLNAGNVGRPVTICPHCTENHTHETHCSSCKH